MKCPSEKGCPFKKFDLLEGMICMREEYPYLIVMCCEKELKHFIDAQEKKT